MIERGAETTADEDAAAVIAVLAAILIDHPPPPAGRPFSAWGRPLPREIGAPGPGAWWASGLPR